MKFVKSFFEKIIKILKPVANKLGLFVVEIKQPIVIGDTWVYDSENPFSDTEITIMGYKDGWVQYKHTKIEGKLMGSTSGFYAYSEPDFRYSFKKPPKTIEFQDDSQYATERHEEYVDGCK